MNQYCGVDVIWTIPKKITLLEVDGKYGIPYIYCNWKIIIDDPTQILDVEFYDYVKEFYNFFSFLIEIL